MGNFLFPLIHLKFVKGPGMKGVHLPPEVERNTHINQNLGFKAYPYTSWSTDKAYPYTSWSTDKSYPYTPWSTDKFVLPC